MRKTSFLWVGLAAVALSGCALTREDVGKPELPLPESLPQPAVTTVALPDPWWVMFEDPMLDSLVREALERNADVAVAAARVAQARALARTARADQLPSLQAQAGAVRARQSELERPDLAGNATGNDFFARGAVSYEADLWGKYALASEAARKRLLASEFDREAVRLSLTGEVARGYFALQAAVAQLEQSNETLHNREESLRIEKIRFDGGESDEITYRRVEAEVASARAAARAFELEVAQRQNVLGVLLGRSPEELVARRIVPGGALPTAAPALPPGLPSSVLERRPDIRVAEAQLEAAAADVGSARADLFPSISLTAGIGSASLALSDLFTAPAATWSVAGALVQPVFEGGRRRAAVERNRAVQEQRRAEYARTVQVAFREVLDGLQGQESLRGVADAKAAQVESLRRATELAEFRYKEGDISYLELLDVRRDLFQAQIELVAARRGTLANSVDLALALGGGLPQS